MVGVDIVVTNYRTPEDLKKFLISLEKHPPSGPYTLTVVDVDPVSRIALTEPYLSVVLDWNCGYGRACNEGAARGRSPAIALFNADTQVTPGLFDDCLQALFSNSSWGILGPRQVNSKDQITHAGIFGTLEAPAHRAWMKRDSDAYADVREAVTVSGAAYFVKRHVWDELTHCDDSMVLAPPALGAFLETKHYYEETWCSYHAQAHGYKVIYYGPACMIHEFHQASPMDHKKDLAKMRDARRIFRDACDRHGIPRD